MQSGQPLTLLFHTGREPTARVDAEDLLPSFSAEHGFEQPRKKRKRHTSSDSSLLDAPARPKLQPFREPDEKIGEPGRVGKSPQSRKKLEADLSVLGDSNYSISPQKQDTFEKRARHKTREDLYEPKKKKEKKSRKNGDEQRPKQKRQKKGDRKKAAKKASENLMHNFQSKNIGQERLTVSSY